MLAKTGPPALAIDAWKRAVDLDPTEFDALYNLTIELVHQGRMDEARNTARATSSTAPAALYAPDIARVKEVIKQEVDLSR